MFHLFRGGEIASCFHEAPAPPAQTFDRDRFSAHSSDILRTKQSNKINFISR